MLANDIHETVREKWFCLLFPRRERQLEQWRVLVMIEMLWLEYRSDMYIHAEKFSPTLVVKNGIESPWSETTINKQINNNNNKTIALREEII